MKKILGVSGLLLAFTGCAQIGSDHRVVTAVPTSVVAIPITANRYWTGRFNPADGKSKICAIGGYIVPGQPLVMVYPTLSCPDSHAVITPLSEGAQQHKEHEGSGTSECAAPNGLAVHLAELGSAEYAAYGKDTVVSSGGVLKPAEVPLPAALVGTWQGSAITASGKQTMVMVDLSRSGRSTTRYVDLKCAADLYLSGATITNTAFTEVASLANTACDARTLTAFSLSDRHTLTRTSFNPQTGQVISESRLQKTGN